MDLYPAARKRNLSRADILANAAAKSDGMNRIVMIACKTIATSKEAFCHPTNSIAVLTGARREKIDLN
jgi:hypothetical protein|tara:strand:- start:3051 stop:3254 length:204 start_codon:yes stop_codon:yes gene_type:complete